MNELKLWLKSEIPDIGCLVPLISLWVLYQLFTEIFIMILTEDTLSTYLSGFKLGITVAIMVYGLLSFFLFTPKKEK